MVIPLNKKIIVGIVGYASCGKDTIAEYLVKNHGFTYISTSDSIRTYMKEHDLGEPVREKMAIIAKQMRDEEGGGTLVTRALDSYKNTDRLVFGGLRTLSEANTVHDAHGFILGITAPIETRYERAKIRGRIGEESFDRFEANEKRESENPDPNAQNINAVLKVSDVIIENVGTVPELFVKIDEALYRIIP